MSTSNSSRSEAENVQQGLRLLSFDGGGIKGLSALIILEHLMFKLKGDATNMPLPCDYFEMIAGTSTGGLIALMLGRLRMSVKEAITAYEKLARHVFSSTNMLGDGKFKASILEQAIKDIVKERTNNENSTLLDGGELGGICNTFVCAMNADNMNAGIPTIFRSYESTELPLHCTIWEAGRATSAAPTFFERIRIGDTASAQSYIDGGMGNNNPTKLLLGEANLMFPGRHIACVISIGTGHPDTIANSRTRSLKRFLTGGLDNLYKVVVALKGIATDSENIHQELARRFSDVHDFYFRFNVDQGMEKIKLSEYEKLSEVRAHTEQYLKMHQPKKSLSDVVRVINARERRLSTAAANHVIQSETAILIPESHITEDKMHREDLILFEFLPGARELHHDGHRLGTCLDKTRTKFLTDINEWISDPNRPPIGWLHGPAGYGKSTVARSIAAQRLSAEFYFSRGNVNRSKPDFVFGNLAWQLANLYPSLKGSIVKAADSEFKRTAPPLEDQPNHLIMQPLLENQKDLTDGVFILIDAIDECQTDREPFLDLIPKLGETLPSFVKVLLVSRLDDDIAKVMRNTKHIPFDIAHAPNTDKDIKLYITTELDKIGISNEQETKALGDRAEGLFAWAVIACGYIRRDPHVRIRELLVKPSHSLKNLHALYEVVFKKAEEEGGFYPDDFKAVIGTIAYAQRPCSTSVLDELLDVDDSSIAVGDNLGQRHSHLSTSKNVTDLLSSLLTVTATSIKFFHSSVYEFVLEDKPTNFGVGADLNAGLSYRCFTIMIHLLKRDICGIDDPAQLNAEVKELDTKLNEFVPEPLEYACIFWAGHLQDAAADQQVLDVIDRFFKKHFLHWVEVMSLLGQMGRVYPSLETARWYIRKFSQSSSPLNDLIDECLWFINKFRKPIEQIAAQVYYSGMAFVPNESSLWTTYAPMIADLRLPNVISGRMTRVPPKPRRHFTADMQPLAVSPIGTLVVYTMNKTLHAWSVEEEHEIPTPGIERSGGSLKDAIFGYDGTFLVIVQSLAVFAWKVEGTTFNRMKPTIARNAAQDSVFVSRYQPHVAIIQKSTGDLSVWDLRTGRNRVKRKILDIIRDDGEFSLHFFGCDEYIAIKVPHPSRYRAPGALFILSISTGTIKSIPDVDFVEVSLYSTVAAVTGGRKCRLMDLVDMRSLIDVTEDSLHISSHATYAWLDPYGRQQQSFCIWRRESGCYVECSPILDADQDEIRDVVFSEDERMIGCFGRGGDFTFYDLAPEPQFAFHVRSGHDSIRELAVAFSQGRSYIALREGNVTQVLDGNSGAIIWTSTIPNSGRLVLSPSGTHVLADEYDNIVDIVNSVTTSQHEVLPSSIQSAIISDDVCAISTSADGKHLLTGSQSGGVQTWDVTNNPNGQMRTVGSKIDFGQHVTSVVYGPGERKIFAVTGGPPWSLEIRYVHDGVEVRPPIVFDVDVKSRNRSRKHRIIGVSHNDEVMAVSSPDGILLINSVTGRACRSWLEVPDWVCIMSRTETLFVWKNGVAGIFDEKRSLVRHFPTLPPRHIETVVFSDDCSTMLLVSKVELTEIIDPATGLVSRLPSSTARCEKYTSSGDGRRVCGVGFSGDIRVWESATGRLLSWTFGYGENLKMSWDGGIVVWNEGKHVHIWDINEHKTKVLLHPESLSSALDMTSSFMLSGDGSTVIQTLQHEREWELGKPIYGYVIFDTTSGQPFQSGSIPRKAISTCCLSGSNDVIVVHGDGIDIISRVTFERRHCPVSVDSATFSADGRFLSMWRNTLKVRLISLPSGTCLRESRIQDGVDLSGVEFFSDDQNVIATLRIREVECAQKIVAWENDTLGLPGWEASSPLENDYLFHTIAYSSDWSSVAMWDGKTIIVTRLERDVLVQHSIVPESQQVDDLVLSTPGKYLAVRVETLVDIYDVSTTSKRLHRLDIYRESPKLVFCPETKSTNAKLLVNYDLFRPEVIVFDVVTGESLELPSRYEESRHIRLSEDGMRIASRDEGGILLFNVAEWCTIGHRKYKLYNRLDSFSFSRDSRWLLIRHGIFSDILNTKDGSVVHESIPWPYENVVTFGISTDGTKLAVVERENHQSLMDTNTLSEAAPDSIAVHSPVWNPDGRLHIQTTVQRVLSAFNIQSGHCQDLILSEGANIDRPQFSHDRTRIGCIVNGHLHSFPTLSTLRNIRENGPGDVCCFTIAASTNDVAFGCIGGRVGLQGPSPNDVPRMSVPVEHRIESIVFICNDQKILSITDDGVIHSWDCKALDSPQQLCVVYPSRYRDIREGVGLALSPDHRHVAVFYYRVRLLLSVSEGVPQTVDKGDSHKPIHSASFSPDSRFLLWIASEASELWELETKHVERIRGGLSVKCCAWSPDSSNLVLDCHGAGFIQLGLHHTSSYPSHWDISYLEDFDIEVTDGWLTIVTSPRTYSGDKQKLLWIYEGLRLLDTNDGFILMEKVNTYDRMVLDLRNYLSQPILRSRFILCDSSIVARPMTRSSVGGLISRRIEQAIVEMAVVSAHTDEYKFLMTNPPEILC